MRVAQASACEIASCSLKNGDWLRRPKPSDMRNQHRPAPPALLVTVFQYWLSIKYSTMKTVIFALALLPGFCAAARTELGEINGAKFRIDMPVKWNGGQA